MKPYKQIKKEQRNALNRLIEYAGNKSRLAKELGIPYTTVCGWCDRGRISATMAIEVEAVTGGEITKEELRPDVIKWAEKV